MKKNYKIGITYIKYSTIFKCEWLLPTTVSVTMHHKWEIYFLEGPTCQNLNSNSCTHVSYGLGRLDAPRFFFCFRWVWARQKECVGNESNFCSDSMS